MGDQHKAIPMSGFRFDQNDTLRRDDGAAFDPWDWTWRPVSGPPAGILCSARAALVRLAASGRLRPVPVGVIGPRVATPAQADTAYRLGGALAAMGLPVLCGGKTGAMEAVAAGARAAGGLCIGLLPEAQWRDANPHVLPIATGIGKARNVLIAQASRALIAVGGELGTLTEIAFALHFDKPVWGLDGAPDVPGLRRSHSVDAACEALAENLLGDDAM